MAIPRFRILELPVSPVIPYPADAFVPLDSMTNNTVRVMADDLVRLGLTRIPQGSLTSTGVQLILSPAQMVPFWDANGNGEVMLYSLQELSRSLVTATQTLRGGLAPEDKIKIDQFDPFRLVPLGGNLGQVLGKLSNNDLDYAWITQTPGTGGGPPGEGGGTLNDVISAGAGVSLVIGISAGGIVSLRAIRSMTPSLLVGSVANGELTLTVQNVTTSQSGFMSFSDKSKLDGIAANAQVNPGVFLGAGAGLVPAAASPPSPSRFLNELGAFAVPATGGGGGGGSGGIPEAPLSDPENPVLYGRVNTIWAPASGVGHTHSVFTLTGVGSFEGAVTNAPLRYIGNEIQPGIDFIPRVDQLADAEIVSPQEGEVLTYTLATQRWKNRAQASTTGTNTTKKTKLVGPTTHAFASTDAQDATTRVNLAAGNVTVTIDNTVSTPAGEELVAHFLTEGGNGVNKLLFQNLNVAVSPNIIGSSAVTRGTNVTTTALTAAAADTRVVSVPAGNNRMVCFLLYALRANDLNPTNMVLTVNGSVVAWDRADQDRIGAEPDVYAYFFPAGDNTEPSNVNVVVGVGTNACSYALVPVFAESVDQTLKYEALTSAHASPTTTTVPVSITTLGSLRRVVYSVMKVVNDTGNPPITIGLGTGPVGTPTAVLERTGVCGSSFNPASGPYIVAHENANAAGTYSANFILPAIHPIARISFAFVPAVTAAMEIRTPDNVAAETTKTNKLVTLIYNSNDAVANLIL